MERTLSNKTVTFTELRDPAKVLRHAGDSPVAILNRNKVVGYFVPKSAADVTTHEEATENELLQVLKSRKAQDESIINYLKDK